MSNFIMVQLLVFFSDNLFSTMKFQVYSSLNSVFLKNYCARSYFPSSHFWFPAPVLSMFFHCQQFLLSVYSFHYFLFSLCSTAHTGIFFFQSRHRVSHTYQSSPRLSFLDIQSINIAYVSKYFNCFCVHPISLRLPGLIPWGTRPSANFRGEIKQTWRLWGSGIGVVPQNIVKIIGEL